MMKIRILAAALAALIAGACAHKKTQIDPRSSTVTKDKVLSLSAEWVKDKKRKFDAQIILTNLSNEPEIVWLKDIVCMRGGVKGVTTMVGTRSGDSPIALRPDAPHTMIVTCDNDVPTPGTMQLNITQVYANPGGDGRTNGKIIAKDLKLDLIERSK